VDEVDEAGRSMEGTSRDGPLEGVRVLDFTQYMQGPWATQMLGDMGADVVKVEPPGGGDWERTYTFDDVWPGGESALFLAMNRNKRSVVIDLKAEAGRDLALRLASSADVVVENARPGVMDRLGIGYEAVRALNPRVIYASATGYGPSGPYARNPGQDLLVQALSGLVSITGRADGAPVPSGTAIADEHGSRALVVGVLLALFHRERTGVGQRVETNLLDTLIDCQCQEIAAFLNGGSEPRRSASGLAHAMAPAPYGIYATADGFLALAMMPLPRLGEILGESWLADYPDLQAAYRSRDEVKGRLEEIFAGRSTAEWLELLGAHDVWCAPVHSYGAMVEDPQVVHNGIITSIEHPKAGRISVTGNPIRLSETPARMRRPPPLYGEHTHDVLSEAGLSDGEIERLRDAGALG
jgi:crotonobetainyl-CoA:carnitine CoA-transferase CaiB-like acyl-CoA transferase